MNPPAPGATAVVIVNFNGATDPLLCLDSLRDQAAGRCPVVVVDNGSTADESPAIAAAHPWGTVLRREGNGGWAGGNNEGIRHALARGAGRIILLNNDTVVAPDFLDRLAATAATADPAFGIIGPVICFMEEPSEVMTDGCRFNTPDEAGFFQRLAVPIAPADGPAAVTEVDIVNGCCMMVAAEVFRRVGLVDERFFLIHEESDLCLRARRAGFRSGVVGAALVWHKGSSTFRKEGRGLQRYYDARNLFLLLKDHRTTCPRRRGRVGSWLGYLKYVYHRYCIEREHDQRPAAEAVVRGLCDALTGRYGAIRPGARPLLPWLMGGMELTRRLKARLAREQGHPA